MLTMTEVRTLVRELSSKKVLSVYLDTQVTDPAMRNAWRHSLTAALRAAAATLHGDDHAEFTRATARLESTVLPGSGTWGAPGWMALATEDGVQFANELPMRTPTMAVWREGPVIAPYLRVMKQHHPVIVALVDSHSARLLRYVWGKLDAVAHVIVPTEAANSAASSRRELRGRAIAAPRSATGTELAARRRRSAFDHLRAIVVERLTELSADGSWILIGGTPVWSRIAGASLPEHLAKRTYVSTSLSFDASMERIATAARHAGSALRSTRALMMLETMLDHAGAEGRAVRGIPATQRALRSGAIDLLMLSPAFLFTDANEAESSVQAALKQGSRVEVLSGEAADLLDREAGGIAGQLRYALDTEPFPAA